MATSSTHRLLDLAQNRAGLSDLLPHRAWAGDSFLDLGRDASHPLGFGSASAWTSVFSHGIGTGPITQTDGGPGADHLVGGDASNDTLNGLGGDDTLEGLGGDDSLNGGDNNDTLVGGFGHDTLNGGNGNDMLIGNGSNAVLLFTSTPSDVLDGGAGNDTMLVQYPNFIINNDPNDPASAICDISTGAGLVELSGYQGEAFTSIEILQFIGPEGDDHVTGGSKADEIYGNGGNDVLKGAGGDDFVGDTTGLVNADGGAGTADTFQIDGAAYTAAQAMVIDANVGTVTVGGAANGSFVNFEFFIGQGGAGNDTFTGFTNTASTILGGGGNDTIAGGTQGDSLQGDAGNDTLTGNGGDDNLFGIGGDDTMYGGGGADYFDLTGGGDDKAYGGIGDDTYLLGGDDFGARSVVDGGAAGDDLMGIDFGTKSNIDLTKMTITGLEGLTDLEYTANHRYNVVMKLTQYTSINYFSLLHPQELITIKLSTAGTFSLQSQVAYDTLQLADGTNHLNVSTATVGAPIILGGTGADTLTGSGTQFFLMDLGGGNDIYTGGAASAQVGGGGGQDTLTGGADSDILIGGAGADHLDGAGGPDEFVYLAASESTGPTFDTVSHFDFGNMDAFGVTNTISKIDNKIASGALTTADFNDDLAAVATKKHLKADHAVLFTPSTGDYNGDTFLVIDINGKAGFQAGKDLVILLDHAAHLNNIDTFDFLAIT